MSPSRAVVLTLAALALGVLGCVQSAPRPGAGATPAAQSTPGQADVPTPSQATPAPAATPTVPGAPAATRTPAPTATAASVPVVSVQRFGWFLEIEGLSDENVVYGDTVYARGKTSPDAIVSVNGVIIPVDADGNFELILTLEEGPNSVNVVASDLDGNEISQLIEIVSLKPEVRS